MTEITEIMATSTDYEELKHVWTEWRNTAGKPIREQYKQFIQLQNKAAQANGTQLEIDSDASRHHSR